MSFRKHGKELTDRRDPMQEFADRILVELEKGVKPWVRPWDPDKCAGPQAPVNPTTLKFYHGVNVLILGMHPASFMTGDPRFCTYQQAREKGWHVKKDERSTTIFFTKSYTVENKEADNDEKTVRVLRHYPVFHASQIEGIPPYTPPSIEPAPWQSNEAADIIIRNAGITMRIGGDRAFYSPTTDHIQIPPSVAFKNAAEEACVKLHEGGHASGAKHRLNRDLSGAFGSPKYSEEELNVEISSAFIGLTLNLPTDIPNHISYIDHWLKPLKNDKRMIFRAAATAQRITDYLLSFHPDYAAQIEPERPFSQSTVLNASASPASDTVPALN
jgi:antirestriction protein ArdC